MTFAASAGQRRATSWLLPAFALAAVRMAINWAGYDGADDRSYALAAEAWPNQTIETPEPGIVIYRAV